MNTPFLRGWIYGFIAGAMVGIAGASALSASAQCCTMYDVPLNTQLEIEHEMNMRDDQNNWRPYDTRPLFAEPCVR